jgi:photosystem II stability/assembly factor-like uncharacterized protein
MLRTAFALCFALAVSSLEARAQTASADHRWAGLVFDAFACDVPGVGVKAWTVEDGGRIRFRNPATGQWSFQPVPDQVKDILHRVTFLTSGAQAGLTGWAAGQGGWVLKTLNGGSSWSVLGDRMPSQAEEGVDPWEELYDVHFVNASEGWLCGKHSLWWTENGGSSWSPVIVTDPGPPAWTLDLADYEVYALDVVQRADGSRLGLAVMEPGIVLRSEAPGLPSHPNYKLVSWEVVFDIRDLCQGQSSEQCKQAGSALPLKGCECDVCPPMSEGTLQFEPWDVEISRNEGPGLRLALFNGGVGAQCGMIFGSTDDGDSWTKEWHECLCTGPGCNTQCNGDPLYNDDPLANDLNRHKDVKTQYGLGIYDANNAALSAGYNGQLLVRDPLSGVWKDRSVFSPSIPTTPGSVKYPLSGAEALASIAQLGFVTGMGGHILETVNGGNTYDASKAIGEPHRTKGLYFQSGSVGWQGGQFFRIGKTTNSGIAWPEQSPVADPMLDNCWAIAFDPSGQIGVAVGDPYTDPVTDTSKPKIRYTLNGGQSAWLQNVAIRATSAFLDNSLRDATWTPGGKFWAAGTGGLILHSSDNGKTWMPLLPAGEVEFNLFQIEALAFLDAANGVFVGIRPDPSADGARRGVAYHYREGQPSSWTSIALPSLPPQHKIRGLHDVEWNPADQSMWVVGEMYVSGVRQGIVLRSAWNGVSFGAFVEQVNPQGFPQCLTGEELLSSPVLTEVEVAPATNDVWVGGMCGRVWVLRAGTWTEIQSQTSAHVTDIAFGPAQAASPVGFVNGFGPGQQCVVRIGNN